MAVARVIEKGYSLKSLIADFRADEAYLRVSKLRGTPFRLGYDRLIGSKERLWIAD